MTNNIIHNSAKLLSANVIAQAIGLAVYPILTRIYTPDDFGSLNVFLSLGGIITLLSTAELQYAIVLARDNHQAWNVLQCGLIILLFTSLCTLFKPLLALYVLIMGLWTLLNYWYTRQQHFGAISRYQIGQSIGSAALKTGMGYIPISSGLIWGSVLAPAISLIANWLVSGRKTVGEYIKTPFRKPELKEALTTFKNFPLFNLPRSLVNNLGSNLPALVLAPVFGLTELGFFSMAITLAFRPINMISGSIYQVLYQQFSVRVQQLQSIRKIFYTYITRAALITLPVFAGLGFILPTLCEWLLGAGWSISGQYIRWMLPWLFCSVLVAPICSLSDVFMEQKKGFFFEILLFIGRIAGMGVGLLTHNFLYAVIGYSLGNTIVMTLQLIWYCSLVRRYETANIHKD